jgi:hypothetical protein
VPLARLVTRVGVDPAQNVHRRFRAVRRTKRVPELTRNVGINLNERLSLRRKAKAIAWSAPDIAPIRTQHSEAVGRIILRSAVLFFGEQSHDRRQRQSHRDDGLEPAASLGGGMALVDRRLPASIYHGPARPWKSLAAPRRTSLEV